MAPLRKETIALKQLIMILKDSFSSTGALSGHHGELISQRREDFTVRKLVNGTPCIDVGSNLDSFMVFFTKKRAPKCKCNYCKDPFDDTCDACLCWHLKEMFSGSTAGSAKNV